MKAVVANGQREIEFVTNAEKPVPNKGQILGHVLQVGLNPIDWKIAYNVPIPKGTIGGTDFVAIVEEVGEGVDASKYIGARVSGWVPGFLSISGSAWAEYVCTDARLVFFVPDSIVSSKACAVPVALTTASQGIHQRIGLPMPNPDGSVNPIRRKWFLVWGGASSVGQYAIQFAKLGGCNVVATCSPNNFEQIKKLGASFVFDYHDSHVVEKIKQATNDSVFFGYDAISLPHTITKSIMAFSSEAKAAKLVTVLGPPENPRAEAVDTITVFSFTAFNEEFEFFGEKMVGNDEDYEHTAKLFELVSTLLEKGIIVPNATREFHGGLEVIPDALREFASGNHSAVKFVINV
ncbi:dehydrogenase [Schizosaccharomyces cryophilus OY26]|uniref:Dehydrogenase n=1 Tax=Schizosaccharomyces cryophilus (strain OY26 / ATCC MYA-4695 / CBS 11777 / NBRC 106824 / NRRL Y48691) TaxID=653667 RepID=S9W5N1_SCHCR|nr:dehydrogenase [Schizosaccharomyces cryophilus OY26]EPY53290.1 dehydrogenase [Schizosaccharomyces cryophilus OY26]